MKFVNGLLSLFYPTECANCGRYIKDFQYGYVCPSCYKRIKSIGKNFCKICGISLPSAHVDTCTACRVNKRHFDYARSAGAYEGALRALIHSLKFHQKTKAGRVIARYFMNNADVDLNGFVFVPVPVSRLTAAERGYNQSEVLAKEVAKLSGNKVINALIKVKETQQQRFLEREDRAKNVKGAFKVSCDVTGMPIALVDDVATTCATLNEAARVLKKSGAGKVICLTAARTL